MIAAGERVVLLADAQKFSMGGVVRICGADELDAVVTDAAVDEPALPRLARAGVEVVRA
jgi:DeoR/GlpR family transcriptional regulator of sugar metabolism